MAIKVFLINDINFENLVYVPIPSSQSINIYYNDHDIGNIPFIIQTPELVLRDDIDSQYKELSLLLDTFSSNFFNKIDEISINATKEYKKYIIPNYDESNNIQLRYKMCVKNDSTHDNSSDNDSDNDEGVINLHIIKDKNLRTIVFNSDKNYIYPKSYGDVFKQNTKLKTIIHIHSLWFKNNTFGLTLRLLQIKVDTLTVNSITSYSFIDKDDKDNDNDNENDSYTNSTSEEEVDDLVLSTST